MQIVILDGYCVNPGDTDWSPLKKLGTLSVYDRTHPDMVAQRLRGADAVFVNKVKLPREILFNARQLKFIGVLATGYDVVDVAAARERGIVVTNVPAYAAEAQEKLRIYRSCGIVPWDDLIISFEKPVGGIDMRLFEAQLKNKGLI